MVMDTNGSSTTLVRRVRTFADDMQRAKTRSGDVDPATISPAVPAIEPTAPIATAPAEVTTPQETPSDAVKKTSAAISDTIARAPHHFSDESHLSDEGKLLDIRSESGQTPQEGTIVKDVRINQWSLGKAVGNSLKEWVGDKKESLSERAEQKNPTPKVAPSETRASVIKAARAESKIAEGDDRRVVVERLRTFARDAERATGEPYAMKNLSALHKEEPKWSQEGDTQQPSPIKQARRTIRPARTALMAKMRGMSADEIKNLEKDVAPTAERMSPDAANIHEEHTPKPQPFSYGTPDVAPVVPTRTDDTPPQAPSRDIAFTAPTFDTQKATAHRTYRTDAIQDVQENQRSIPAIAAAQERRRGGQPRTAPHRSPKPFIIATVFMVVVMVFGGFGLFLLSERDTQPTGEVARIPTFITIENQVPVTFSTNRVTLLTRLTEAVAESGRGVTQLYPTYGENVAAPTSDVMYVLEPRVPGSFIRNLSEEMMIGSVDGDAPFIILKSNQFETSFAGMLDWEPYMSADLSPLFGTPVRATIDPTARTVGQTRTPFFIDSSIRNVDVRILYDELAEERIIYGFTDRRTIVITTTLRAMTELIERLQ